jgi:transcriptional regulator with XRE-family HTH domain
MKNLKAAKAKAKTSGIRTSDRHSLSGQLRDVIAARGLTAYAVAKAASVDVRLVQRFLDGERDIRLETADKIAQALGLRLVEVATRKGQARAHPPSDR